MKKVKLLINDYSGTTEIDVDDAISAKLTRGYHDSGVIEDLERKIEDLTDIVSNLIERLTISGRLDAFDMNEIVDSFSYTVVGIMTGNSDE